MNILLDPNARPVVAHRGGALHAPENTIEAMALAISRGAEAIECDIRISSDGEVVVFHDPFVNRTTGKPGAVSRMTFAELRSLDASVRRTRPASWDASVKTPCRIPTLEEVLVRFPETPFIIEVKAPAASAAARRIIEKYRAENRCLVASFPHGALHPFRGSRIPIGATRRDIISFLRDVLARRRPLAEFDAFFIPPDYHGVPMPMRILLAAAREAGKNTHIWTVNDATEAGRLWRLGALGMVTDDVPGMLAARSAFPG